jgi:hypothetical protein
MATFRIRNVAHSRHFAKELRHWTVLFDLLRKRSLRAEGLVSRH